ncbi:MAG: hypothetical protein IT425_13165 [Pirellulales bacterium]|nr:hypothetical protein [Pirellulales bacterium]
MTFIAPHSISRTDGEAPIIGNGISSNDYCVESEKKCHARSQSARSSSLCAGHLPCRLNMLAAILLIALWLKVVAKMVLDEGIRDKCLRTRLR